MATPLEQLAEPGQHGNRPAPQDRADLTIERGLWIKPT
ncbi:Uncharacterised protein [Mycobacteroides abscessus subsp. abscessus]|nr:Uncharacterised protein [Mycobacteroides abscessus subsp. abscessus]